MYLFLWKHTPGDTGTCLKYVQQGRSPLAGEPPVFFFRKPILNFPLGYPHPPAQIPTPTCAEWAISGIKNHGKYSGLFIQNSRAGKPAGTAGIRPSVVNLICGTETSG